MVIGLLKELDGEHRVSLLPDTATQLIKLKAEVWFEHAAGMKSFEKDKNYETTGAILKTRDEILSQADVILTIQNLPLDEIGKIKSGAILLGVFQPLYNFKLMLSIAEKNVSTFSLDMLPRTTRAQIMDVLSSQASIAGYKAVLVAANQYPKYLPMLMTAAGTIAPAKILILGAGVAGLQAIATAKRLGAVVEVFDTRPAVKEEVTSLGGRFIEIEGAADASKAGGYGVEQTEEYKQKQKARIHEAIIKADIVISTAQIPGKRAPILITEEMVAGMRAGSVIVDLAAATGGNCDLTHNNETVIYNGVSIIGNSNLPSLVPGDASKLYGKNVLIFLIFMIDPSGAFLLNFDYQLIKGCCMTLGGKIVNDRVSQLLNP